MVYRAFPQDKGGQSNQTQFRRHDDEPLFQISGRYQLIIIDDSSFVWHADMYRIGQGEPGQFLNALRQRSWYHHILASSETTFFDEMLLHYRYNSVENSTINSR